MKFLLIVVLFLGCPLVLVAAQCPVEWTFVDGYCYYSTANDYSFWSAEEGCRKRGGDLVTLNTDEEKHLQHSSTRNKYICKKVAVLDEEECEEGWHHNRMAGNCLLINHE
ncbi:hypothetical protein CAPTEDRAFT_204811, partial [Capitella teleta]